MLLLCPKKAFFKQKESSITTYSQSPLVMPPRRLVATK